MNEQNIRDLMKSVEQKNFISEYPNWIPMLNSSQRKYFVFFDPVIFYPLDKWYSTD